MPQCCWAGARCVEPPMNAERRSGRSEGSENDMFIDFIDTPAIEDRPHLIGELADRFGVSLRTLRFYEEKGLIKPTRDASRNRLYTATEVARIAFIVECRRVGMAVDDIRDLVDIRRNMSPTAFRERVRRALEQRREALEHEITERVEQNTLAMRWLHGIEANA